MPGRRGAGLCDCRTTGGCDSGWRAPAAAWERGAAAGGACGTGPQTTAGCASCRRRRPWRRDGGTPERTRRRRRRRRRRRKRTYCGVRRGVVLVPRGIQFQFTRYFCMGKHHVFSNLFWLCQVTSQGYPSPLSYSRSLLNENEERAKVSLQNPLVSPYLRAVFPPHPMCPRCDASGAAGQPIQRPGGDECAGSSTIYICIGRT